MDEVKFGISKQNVPNTFKKSRKKAVVKYFLIFLLFAYVLGRTGNMLDGVLAAIALDLYWDVNSDLKKYLRKEMRTNA